MELPYQIALIALIVAGAWWFFQPRYEFVVRIEDGLPRLSQGKVTAAFLQQIREVCAEYGVVSGWVGGILKGRRRCLSFSRGFPSSGQQQLRNLWALKA